MERLAAEAERASVKYKQVEYMSDKTGKVFEGVISGVTEWGIYVEIIENQCEGMIHIRELADDFYEYDEENYCIKGRSTGKVYTLGDRVNIEVVKADLQKKQLDYRLVNGSRLTIFFNKLKQFINSILLPEYFSVQEQFPCKYALCRLLLQHIHNLLLPFLPDRLQYIPSQQSSVPLDVRLPLLLFLPIPED